MYKIDAAYKAVQVLKLRAKRDDANNDARVAEARFVEAEQALEKHWAGVGEGDYAKLLAEVRAAYAACIDARQQAFNVHARLYQEVCAVNQL